jgi:hypothetical protein
LGARQIRVVVAAIIHQSINQLFSQSVSQINQSSKQASKQASKQSDDLYILKDNMTVIFLPSTTKQKITSNRSLVVNFAFYELGGLGSNPSRGKAGFV